MLTSNYTYKRIQQFIRSYIKNHRCNTSHILYVINISQRITTYKINKNLLQRMVGLKTEVGLENEKGTLSDSYLNFLSFYKLK